MSKSRNLNSGETPINTEEKFGVEIFLQRKPQEFGISEMLKKKYKMSAMTLNEWEVTLDKVMNKKIIS